MHTDAPLGGLRVLEFQSAGPAPLCNMLLGDMGADVITVSRPGYAGGPGAELDPTGRNRRSIVLDLKQSESVDIALRLAEQADVLTEGLRPGVMERLGLGPDIVTARNPALVYARMTGWGQEGPFSQVAGHDHNYLAISGVLSTIGLKGGPPVPPLNLVGDNGGGGMLLAFGILTALYERSRSGNGQVLDVAMVDGASLLMSIFHGMRAAGQWLEERGTNLLDSGAPFARTYETSDGQYVSVCSMEPEFYLNTLRVLELDQTIDPASQHDRSTWPPTSEVIADRFRTQTRAYWTERFTALDTCVTPVLTMSEAYEHPHALARGAFLPNGPGKQPAPAPRFSRSRVPAPLPPRKPGQDTDAILCELGLARDEIDALRRCGVIS